MIYLVENGGENQRVMEDPRFSRAQVAAMRQAAERDPRAGVLGLDQKMRPVLRVLVAATNRRSSYALLRNGDPTRATEPLAERW